MNIVESVAEVIENQYLLELGIDLFIGSSPRDAEIPHAWLIWGGGYSITQNQTGERIKNHTINFYYRSESPKDVYDFLQQVERFFNSAHCLQLTGFVTINSSSVVFPTDNDIDLEGMTIGTLTIEIQVYE